MRDEPYSGRWYQRAGGRLGETADDDRRRRHLRTSEAGHDRERDEQPVLEPNPSTSSRIRELRAMRARPPSTHRRSESPPIGCRPRDLRRAGSRPTGIAPPSVRMAGAGRAAGVLHPLEQGLRVDGRQLAVEQGKGGLLLLNEVQADDGVEPVEHAP